MPQKLVSVIVVNYDGHRTIRDCITSIIRSKYVDEILLIDNCSKDESLASIEDCDDNRLSIIRLSSNVGLCRARNLGAAEARGRYLAFVDQDTKVHQNWLEEPVTLLEMHKEIGAVQCVNLSLRNPDIISHGGVGLDGLLWKGFPRSTLHHKSSYWPVLYPIGAGFVIRRDAWQTVKGFDPAFFIGNDDIDLGIRLWLAGYEVACAPKAIVYHDDASGDLRSRRDTSRIFAFYGVRNLLSLWTKNISGRKLLKHVLPFSLMIPFMALFESGPWGILAIVSFLRDLPIVYKKRVNIQSSRKISDQKIMRALQGILPSKGLARELTTAINYLRKTTPSIRRQMRQNKMA